jgi:sialic acid synthase SpsE
MQDSIFIDISNKSCCAQKAHILEYLDSYDIRAIVNFDPVLENSYGDTYGEHRDFLEFSVAQNKELKEYCDSLDMVYTTSVWDVTNAKKMLTFEPEFLKVPSLFLPMVEDKAIFMSVKNGVIAK